MATSRKRNVEIQFIVDDKAAAKSLHNVETQVTKTGKAFSNAGKLIASGLVLDRVVGFAGQALSAYSSLNESLNAVEVTFGGAAQGIKEMGEQAADSLGLSNAEFNGLAVSFSAFVDKIAQGSGQTVIPVMDELTTRISDFASVMDLDVAEAAEKFRSGLAGETEPLRKYSIDVSAAAVNSKALALGLAESSSELTEGDKVLARYQLIMEQTAKTAGDFENTQDDLANATRRAEARFTDFTARLGEELAPVAKEATTAGMNLLDAFDEDVNLGWTQRLSAAMQTILAESPETVAAYIEQKEALNDLADAAGKVEIEYPSEADIKLAESADKAFRAQGEALGILAEEADEAATASQKLSDIQKEASDPAFKLLSTLEKYDDAQKKYTDAITDFGHESGQAQDAAIDVAEALADLNAAGADFSAEGGQSSIDAIVDLLEAGGVLPETIRAIIDAIKEYNDTPITRKSVFVPGVGNVTPGTGGSVGGNGTMIGFAEGGVVPGPKGAPMPALVHGGETVFTPDQLKALSGIGAGTGTLINLYATSLSDRQLKEVQEMARRS